MRRLLTGVAAAAALMLPASAASASDGPIAGVGKCPPGQFGVTVWHADYNTGGPVDLVRVCFPLEP